MFEVMTLIVAGISMASKIGDWWGTSEHAVVTPDTPRLVGQRAGMSPELVRHPGVSAAVHYLSTRVRTRMTMKTL